MGVEQNEMLPLSNGLQASAIDGLLTRALSLSLIREEVEKYTESNDSRIKLRSGGVNPEQRDLEILCFSLDPF